MRRWIEPNWKYTKAIESNRSVALLLYHSSMRCNGLFIPLVVADLQQLGLLSRRKQIQPTARCCNGESASWTIRAATGPRASMCGPLETASVRSHGAVRDGAPCEDLSGLGASHTLVKKGEGAVSGYS